MLSLTLNSFEDLWEFVFWGMSQSQHDLSFLAAPSRHFSMACHSIMDGLAATKQSDGR